MTIRVWGYLNEYHEEREAIHAAIEDVLTSGQLILGPRVAAFEQAFAAYCGVPYGVGVGNGTDALFLALKSLGIGPGDEVISVSNTAVPTIAAIVAAGATPRFVDVDPRTYLMDTHRLPEAITPRTRAILPVHLFGQCVDMSIVSDVARRHRLSIIEDCAQSHGATHHGQRAGSMSDVAAFSFYPTKILGTFGDGGMVITSHSEPYQKLRRLRSYGMEGPYYSKEHGYNSRLDELHAAILHTKLPHLDGYIERRRALARRYDSALAKSGLGLPVTASGNAHAYYLYVVRHPERDRIIESLAARDIDVNVSYRWPIHLMEAYKPLGYREGDLPETEKAAREIFSLPMYPSLTNDEQDRVICQVLEILRGIAR